MNSKSGKPLVQSITGRLSKLAQEQRKPYDKLQTIFLLERAVSRLTQDNKLAMHMVFKGGYVSVRVYDSALLKSKKSTIEISEIKAG